MILNDEQIQAMREGGKILADIFAELAKQVRPGVVTNDIEKLAGELILKYKVKPSFLGFNRYPAVLCASVNEEAVHALPSDRVLKEGDLFKLDFGVVHKGLHTDMAKTILVTDKSKLATIFKTEYSERLRLVKVTREALDKGIAQARLGNTLGDIGHAIQNHIEQNGLTVVRELGGHGIGKGLHESPWIGNFGEPGGGAKLVKGMAIALEPIVSTGKWQIKEGRDGFAYVMKDGSLSAHFEHTLIITKGAPLVVTR